MGAKLGNEHRCRFQSGGATPVDLVYGGGSSATAVEGLLYFDTLQVGNFTAANVEFVLVDAEVPPGNDIYQYADGLMVRSGGATCPLTSTPRCVMPL